MKNAIAFLRRNRNINSVVTEILEQTDLILF